MSILRRAYIFVLVLVFSLVTYAQETTKADTVDHDAPDFVKASLIIADPGEVLYSCVGHACIRLQCPAYGLDFCFSYESEDGRDKVLMFLAGSLKMGMFAIPTEEYLDEYKGEGRGVCQYHLNLPIEVKRNLWQLLDNKVSEGANLPYDYLARGCAQSTLQSLLEAITVSGLQPDFGEWPEKYEQTRRELTVSRLTENPWTHFFLEALVGIDIDYSCTNIEKVIMPQDLLALLQTTSVQGAKIIDTPPTYLVPSTPRPDSIFAKVTTPLAVSSYVLLLAFISFFRAKTRKYTMFPLLILQFVVGVFLTYLILFSDLPCTSWNWLFIPFNPLPLIFWHYRRYWLRPYMAILVLWMFVMVIYPHRLTDLTYVSLTLSIVVIYLAEWRSIKCAQ